MPSGDYRHPITIEHYSEVQDSLGEPVKTWRTFATAMAAIDPLRGREFMDARGIATELSHRIRLRYLQGVKPKMRVIFGLRTFDIQAVLNPEERNKELHLMCIERD